MIEPSLIVPSVLPADFARVGAQVADLCAARIDHIQWDVMDGGFVPNLTFGPNVIAATAEHCTVGSEAHLMVVNPDQLLPRYVEVGCELIMRARTGLHALAPNTRPDPGPGCPVRGRTQPAHIRIDGRACAV